MPTVSLIHRSLSETPAWLPSLMGSVALSTEALEQVDEYQRTHGGTWVQAALALSTVPSRVLAVGLSESLGYDLWREESLETMRLDLWAPEFCIEHQLLAWVDDKGNHHVATADPTDHVLMERAQAHLSSPLQWWVADSLTLEAAMRQWQQRWEWQSPSTPTSSENTPPTPLSSDERAIEDVPVVKLLHELMSKAHRMRASDLHIEPYEHHVRVRWRIDGHLHEMCSVPLTMRDALASRLKVLARLDIAEKRLPQDGRVELQLNGQTVHGRVNSLPTVFGEKLVLRLLPQAPVHRELKDLGLEPPEWGDLSLALARPQGMVLVTGPTGSGKTVTLYACLQTLNQAHVNIATAEDPCEIHVSGINQLQIHEKAGLTFATALRAFLRQDPDILMIGEIRDMETADMAIKAAQTGHLVLTTLHTNDAPATLTRLLNMGVPAYNIVASVKLVVAQRLVRRLCPHCKQHRSMSKQDWLSAGGWDHESTAVFEPVGCARCHQGFQGRLGLYQTMPLTDDLQALVLSQGTELVLRQWALAHGMRSLRHLGLMRVLRGETSLSEVLVNTPDG